MLSQLRIEKAVQLQRGLNGVLAAFVDAILQSIALLRKERVDRFAHGRNFQRLLGNPDLYLRDYDRIAGLDVNHDRVVP